LAYFYSTIKMMHGPVNIRGWNFITTSAIGRLPGLFLYRHGFEQLTLLADGRFR